MGGNTMKNRIMRAAVTPMWGLALVVASAVLAFPSAAAAQPTFTVSVFTNDQPLPNVNLYWAGDKLVLLGATDDKGSLSTGPTHVEFAETVRKRRRVGAFWWGHCEEAPQPPGEVYLTNHRDIWSRLEAWGAVRKRSNCKLETIDSVTLHHNTFQLDPPNIAERAM